MTPPTFRTRSSSPFRPTLSRRQARQRGLSRPRLLLLVALALILGGLGWWVWHPKPTADAPGGTPGAGARRMGGNRAQPVSVAAVRRQDVRVTVTAIGTISALNTATVRARADGELRSIRFTEGQTVRAGQLLAEIDPRPYEVALAQARGQLARDAAQLKNAQLDLARYQDLLTKDSIARQQVDTQQALVRQLQGTVQADQAQVDNAALQLSYTRITAPISGRLGLRLVDLGNIVHASDTGGLVTITQTQPISVVFAVPETHLGQIGARLRGGPPPMVEAWDREQRQRLATGQVITTDNAIDTATGTIKLKARFANEDNALFPNQFVNVRLQLDTLVNALVVPSNAVQRGSAGTFVYVAKDDGSVVTRRIQLGAVDGDWVAVQGELTPGERVVTDGADRLRDGARVEVIAPAAAASAGAADRPRMGKLSPEEREQLAKMSPDERQAFLAKRRPAEAGR